MNLRRRILSGAALLATGQVVGQGFSFIRNIIIARLISPNDFGIAATFVIAVSLLEMSSNLAADRLLVQAEDGNDERFQETAHLLMAVRGTVNAVLLFLLAWPFSRLFNIPEARWAFQCLAIVPLVMGFAHLDRKRLHRDLRFGRDTIVDVVDQVIPLIAAWPLAIWLGDYSAVLWLLIGKSVVSVATSHLVAHRPYRLAWHGAYLKRMLTFGWPLLVNGLLMFGIFHGDRLVVGTAYTMTDLGFYSVAFTLTMVPTMMLVRIVSALFLPLLSNVQTSPHKFRARYTLSVQALCPAAALLATLFILGGTFLVTEIYGDKYAPAGTVIGWVAAMQAVRLMRVTPALAAMAKGDTQTLMLSNIARSCALALVVLAAIVHAELWWIAAAGLVGELLALGLVLARLTRLHNLPAGVCIRPACLAFAAILLGAGIADVAPSDRGWLVIVGAAVALSSAVFVATLLLFSDFRRDVLTLIGLVRETKTQAAL